MKGVKPAEPKARGAIIGVRPIPLPNDCFSISSLT